MDLRGIELNRKKRKEAEEQERIKAEKAANTVHSKEEAISAVKAFYKACFSYPLRRSA